MSNSKAKTGIEVVLWHGTAQEEHVVPNYRLAMEIVDERHQNRHDPAFYDVETGERLFDDGEGFCNEDGEQVY